MLPGNVDESTYLTVLRKIAGDSLPDVSVVQGGLIIFYCINMKYDENSDNMESNVGLS